MTAYNDQSSGQHRVIVRSGSLLRDSTSGARMSWKMESSNHSASQLNNSFSEDNKTPAKQQLNNNHGKGDQTTTALADKPVEDKEVVLKELIETKQEEEKEHESEVEETVRTTVTISSIAYHKPAAVEQSGKEGKNGEGSGEITIAQ